MLQAWRWQQVLRIFDHARRHRAAHRVHARGPVRRQRAARRRSAATSCASAASAPTIDSNETAFASVAIERLTGFVALPALVVVGFVVRPVAVPRARTRRSRSCIAAITVGALVADPRRGRAPPARRSLRRQPELDPLHRRGARRRRPAAALPAQALGVVGTSLAYQVSVIVAVLCIVRTLELPVPTARGHRVRPRGRDGAGRADLDRRPRRARRHARAVPASVRRDATRRRSRSACSGTRACSSSSMLGAPAFAVGKRRQPAVAETTRLMATAPTPTRVARDRSARGRRLQRRLGHLLVARDPDVLALLLRVLRDPEREQERSRRRRCATRARSSARAPPRHLPRGHARTLGAAREGAHHRVQLLLRRRCTSSSRSASRSCCSATGPTTTRAGATRSACRPASRSSASSPIRSCRRACSRTPHALRLRRHARQVPDALVVRLRRGEQDLEPVRGDAERALLLGAVVRVRARPAPEASRRARRGGRCIPCSRSR